MIFPKVEKYFPTRRSWVCAVFRVRLKRELNGGARRRVRKSCFRFQIDQHTKERAIESELSDTIIHNKYIFFGKGMRLLREIGKSHLTSRFNNSHTKHQQFNSTPIRPPATAFNSCSWHNNEREFLFHFFVLFSINSLRSVKKKFLYLLS